MSNIPIATLYDVEAIAANPVLAVSEVKSRIGVLNSAHELSSAVPDREGDLMGWTLRFLDRHAPT